MKEITIIVLGFLVFNCTSSFRREEQQIMKEAAILHNAMMERAEAFEAKWNTLSKDSSYALPADSLMIWKKVFEQWESELVEVPGNEVHIHKEGAHHHDHTVPDVTAAQMMVIQLELQRRQEVLERRIDQSDSLKN